MYCSVAFILCTGHGVATKAAKFLEGQRMGQGLEDFSDAAVGELWMSVVSVHGSANMHAFTCIYMGMGEY